MTLHFVKGARRHRSNPRGDALQPGRELTGYLVGGELQTFKGKPLGWSYGHHRAERVKGYRHPETGELSGAITLVRPVGPVLYYAAGYSLGEGMLFRGEVVGTDENEARSVARSLGDYWSERDLEDEQLSEEEEG